jgi:hypothetical protein
MNLEPRNEFGFSIAALQHFGLEGAPIVGVPSLAINSVEPYIQLRSSKYAHILNILQEERSDGSALKSFYIMSRCPVSSDRVKHMAKNNNLKLTNDYLNADCLVTHNNLENHYYRNHRPNTTALFIKNENNTIYTFENKIENIASVVNNNYMWFHNAKSHTYMKEWHESILLIKNKTLDIAYLIDTGVIKNVKNIETISKNSQMLVAMDEKLLDLLVGMTNSSNKDDIAIAGKIIPTLKQDENFHLLWQFYQRVYNLSTKFPRNKDVLHWIEQNCYDYSTLSAIQLIRTLHEDSKLTNDSFKYLEAIARKEVYVVKGDIYKCTFSIKPEYLNL